MNNEVYILVWQCFSLNILFLWFFHGNMADLLLTVACYSKTLCLCLTLFLIFPWASGIFHYCCYGESALDILTDISWYKSASISLGCTLSLEFLGCRTMWTSHCTEKCFSSVQSLSCVWLFATPWIAAHQTSLSITNSKSSLRLTSIESVMPFSNLILCRPLLLLPPTPPSIRVFSNESTLRMRWPKYWSFNFSVISSKEIPGLIKSLLHQQSSKASILRHPAFFPGPPQPQERLVGMSPYVFSPPDLEEPGQKHQFFGAQPSSQSNSHIHTWPQEKP